MSILVSIENLLSGNFVEGMRMEFKEGWNPVSVMRSVCAFANDFENEGSGYIVIGVAEKNGKALRPVIGFDPKKFDKTQKELVGYCNLISPSYVPRLSLEEIDGKHVLTIWVPAGSNRPYKVPDNVLAKHKTYNYRIRQFSSSVIPNAERETELIQLTAKTPFDDRVNTHASVNELGFGLMREHLAKTGSKLFQESAIMNKEELADKMNLCQGAKEHLFPKNVGLLMFSENTNKFFRGVQIDVVEFLEGLGAKEFEENTYVGTIQKQLTDVLSYFKTHIVKSKVIKYADRAESDTISNYPYEAIEEALSNAVYHRNYELQDPIEVRVLPTSIEIISYNGIDPSLKQSDFDKGAIRNRRYRNRRIGEFLKELNLTEGRGTGIPTMKRVLSKNGSEAPKFDTNEPERSFFVTELLIHPDFPIDENGGGQIANQIGGQIELSDRQKEVLEILKADNKTSRKAISEQLNISESVVLKILGTLKEKNLIERNGGTRGYWKIIIDDSIGGQITNQIDGQIKLSNRQKEVLKLIDANNKISRADISVVTHISESAIQKHLKALKEKGILKRVGGTRGFWKIKKQYKNG
ncbi:MAG: transcriptional regulator [Bacteroidetes bacterium]|nr:MAG: transcriptional regulator [Bacteroidota bacterium]